MICNPQFNYKQLQRTDGNGGRFYETESGPLPSVTTILSATSDKTFLKEWRSRVGDENANAIVKRSTTLGTLMHKHLENYVLGNGKDIGDNYVHRIAKKMGQQIIDNGLSHVSEYMGVEAGLYYPSLFAGTADLIALYDGELAIIDYKNSLKLKKEEWVENYKVQCTAYGSAHDELYNTNIRKCVIMLCTQEYEYQQFIIDISNYDSYKEKWCEILERYYKLS